MNGRQKGKRIELEFRRLLESWGFLVNPTPPGSMWNKQTDHWGRFDLEAIPSKRQEYTHYIQIATRWKAGEDRKYIESFPKSPYRRIFMVRKKDRRDFEMKEFLMGEWLELDLSDFESIWSLGKPGMGKELKGGSPASITSELKEAING